MSAYSTAVPLSAEQVPRFWSKVDKTGDCWLWQHTTNSKGYGQISFNKRTYPAHRLACRRVGSILQSLGGFHLSRGDP